ncbi:glycosyltransferase family 2 protein [Candidatus Falkowbacteria bacterium]|nr:glycosyltransferase family 2 protein [Candidatus Falkowbacteria bacterium]
MTQPKISVVIPCYNESAIISQTIAAVADFFRFRSWPFELIVVDDASTDTTVKLAAKYSWVTIIRNPVNRGKGYSVKVGMLAASGELILFTDADLSTPMAELPKLLRFAGEYDIIIGSRAVQGAYIGRRQPIYKMLIGKLGNYWIRLCLGLPFRDTQCGFKLFRRRTRFIFQKQTLDRWGFDFEVLYLAQQHKLKIREVGVSWYNDASSLVTFGGYGKTLWEVLQVRLNALRGKYN